MEFDLLLNQNVKWETLECFLEEIYPWIFCFHEETNFLYKTSITCIILSCSVGILNALCNTCTCTMYFFLLCKKVHAPDEGSYVENKFCQAILRQNNIRWFYWFLIKHVSTCMWCSNIVFSSLMGYIYILFMYLKCWQF